MGGKKHNIVSKYTNYMKCQFYVFIVVVDGSHSGASVDYDGFERIQMKGDVLFDVIVFTSFIYS